MSDPPFREAAQCSAWAPVLASITSSEILRLAGRPAAADIRSAEGDDMTALSILDLAPVPLGATPGDALRRSRALAQHAERLGYTRFWLAEHHNMTGIASAATAVAIGYVAEGT